MSEAAERRSPPAEAHTALELDHVLLAVEDLASAARLLEDRYGLASVEGGRHRAWGTANRIVPLGGAYLELVAVVDDGVARSTSFGSWVAAAEPAPVRLLGWAVRTGTLDAVSSRLGLAVSPGSRPRPDGGMLHWRLAGLDEAIAAPYLPFFIEWGEGTHHPGQASLSPRESDRRVARLRLDGDPDRLAAWLDGQQLPVTVSSGDAAVTGVTLVGAAGEITLDAGLR